MNAKVEGCASLAAPVTCGKPVEVVADAVLLIVLDGTPALAEVDLTTEDEELDDEGAGALLDAELTTTEEVEDFVGELLDVELAAEVDGAGVLLVVLRAALELEEVTDVEEGVGVLLLGVVEVGLIIAGAVLVFAAAWLVTATLGVIVEDRAAPSVAGIGMTVSVLVLDATIA